MGSFEAGAVSAIVNLVNAEEVEYDVLTGKKRNSSNILVKDFSVCGHNFIIN